MTGRGQGSAGDLLELVRKGRATTRGALQQATGLSRATVGQRLDRLFRAGWLREGAGGPVDSPLGGRPSITLEFDDAHAVVLAADLDTRHARAALLTLTGELLAEHGGTLVVEDGPEAVLGELAGWFARLLEKAGHGPDEVCGIGLAVPGPVDSETGRVVQPPIMPGWDGFPVREALSQELGCPVMVDNDVNLMAVGEQHAGVARSVRDFLCVKIGTGIGCGIVVGGEVYRGTTGSAGDIGHIPVEPGGRACACGNRGCLEAHFSGAALAADAEEAARSGRSAELADRLEKAGRLTAEDVSAAAAAGDTVALELIREGGTRLGQVIAGLVSFFNPADSFPGSRLCGAAGCRVVDGRPRAGHSMPTGVPGLLDGGWCSPSIPPDGLVIRPRHPRIPTPPMPVFRVRAVRSAVSGPGGGPGRGPLAGVLGRLGRIQCDCQLFAAFL
ncbi:ROK family protein [Nocardia sp. NPDC050193]